VDIVLSPVVVFLIALTISVWVIPLAIRIAPRIGMIDEPDPRKIHRAPIARVGGVGIAAGALLVLVLLAPRTPFLCAFLVGSVILAFFGAWDDVRELGHYPKFAGQLFAAALVVWYGGVWISDVPFLATPLPAWLGQPFTVVAIVGVINAINHSDGLDGLAGGETALSLGAMSCLAYLSRNADFLIFTAAVGGGLLGFMRYNTYPAKVFMGDLGSQFLGFAVAVFAIALTQQVNHTLSKSLALLLVGLPVLDILVVLYLRIKGKMNWFKATRNHTHHRLLDLNFDHHQAVLIIYSVQALLTFVAVFIAYESDVLILAVYFSTCGSLFLGLVLAEKLGWRLMRTQPSLPSRLMTALSERSTFSRGILLFIQISVPVYLLLTSAEVSKEYVGAPVGTYTVTLIALLALLLAFGVQRSPAIYRLVLFSSVGMIAYCIYCAPPALNLLGVIANVGYFAALALAVALAALFRSQDDFSPSNMDFLVVAALVTAAVFSNEIIGAGSFWTVAIGTTVVFYACELIILRGGKKWNRILSTSAVGSLGIIVGKVFL
jgi:UDP-GlcNAc:undecaprenyl-phosphate GlcNAc-1-phosphate transferase